jgi:hypothetical protein
MLRCGSVPTGHRANGKSPRQAATAVKAGMEQPLTEVE